MCQSEFQFVEAIADKAADLPGDMEHFFARAIKLRAGDQTAVIWHERAVRPLPSAPPFTLEDGLRRLRAVGDDSWVGFFRWKNAGIPEFPSREEAQFWVLAVEALGPEQASPQSVAESLAGVRLDGRVPAERIKRLADNRVMADGSSDGLLPPLMLRCAAALLEPEELIASPGEPPSWLTAQAAEQFRERIFPYLSTARRDALRRRIDALEEATVPPAGCPHGAPVHYQIAAVLGCHDRLRAFLRQLPDGAYAGGILSPWLIFGLGDAASVEREWRRLRATLRDAAQARAWIALTGYNALDVIADSAGSDFGERGAAAKVARALLLVAAPEAALPALRIAVGTDARTVGLRWLAEHPGHAAVGLTPVAMDANNPLARVARKHLQTLPHAGLASVLQQAAKRLPPVQGTWLRKHLLAGNAKITPPPVASLPEPLRAAFARVKAAKPQPWLSVGVLPPIRVAGGALARAEVELVLGELRRLAPDASSDLLVLLKEHADSRSLDGFTAKVFDLWTAAGQPGADQWVLASLVRLGGDHLTARLAAQIRVWPDERKLSRARFGVACLAAVASDAALNALQDFSLKHRWSVVRHDSNRALRAVAARRGMTPQELADGIVTDAGLDEKGMRVFDFGPRRFTLALQPDLQPTLRDAEGRVRPDLPAPTRTDDAGKAARALADWTLLKQTLRDTLRVQARRLEDRMIHGRRWTPESFRRRIVGHPLLGRLARRLVLGTYDGDGRLRASFRVTEDRTFADAHDAAYTLPDAAEIGVAHPVQLDAVTRAAWRATLDDYGIVPPFSQTARPVHGADPCDLEADAIRRFAGRPVSARHLFGTLEGDGWARGQETGGALVAHEKYFEAADQTAVIRYTGLSVFNVKDAPPQEVVSVQFLRGEPGNWWTREPDLLLKIAAVDPLVLSEALRVAHAIVERAD